MTLDLDRSVLVRLRRRSEREGKSLDRLTSELLSTALDESYRHASAAPFRWTSADLGVSRVDLEDKNALRRVIARAPEGPKFPTSSGPRSQVTP